MEDITEDERPDQRVINWETPKEVKTYIEKLEQTIIDLQEEKHQLEIMIDEMSVADQ